LGKTFGCTVSDITNEKKEEYACGLRHRVDIGSSDFDSRPMVSHQSRLMRDLLIAFRSGRIIDRLWIVDPDIVKPDTAQPTVDAFEEKYI
jgi:hypothetical protein